ncbi:PREDICTED: ornithine decarboxylase 2-like [Odobenus rosmarus divergens]|uniref:Ornithine decarboxylase 2-like n=1 Tax=Odobenus rosmarus divergens TaxID=9708 RepID=A0A9B0GWT2_ODORO
MSHKYVAGEKPPRIYPKSRTPEIPVPCTVPEEAGRDGHQGRQLGVLASHHQAFCRTLPRVPPFYAMKCNNSTWGLRVLATLGAGFDRASQRARVGSKPLMQSSPCQVELEQVLGLGVAPSCIMYANPCKPVSHIQYTALHGLRLLTFDSEEELSKVAQHHPEARLVLWLWTQDSESTFPLSAKVGATLEVCEHLLKSARALGWAVVGASFHMGLKCQTVRAFTQALADCRCVFEMGLLDIGGGFPGEEGCEPKFEEIARVINAVLAQDFSVESGVEIIAEPGRFYAASVYMAAANLIAKKTVLESGGEAVPRMPIVVKEFGSEPSLFPRTCYGPTCDAFDKLFLGELRMPELDVGDWLVFPSMGSYTSTMSSTSSGFPPASIC